MATGHDADLILKLYDLRREPVMREARNFMLTTFWPETVDEFLAVQRVKKIPIVFNYVADPIAAGAGTSATSHAPNVTGVYLIAAYDKMLPLLRASQDASIVFTSSSGSKGLHR